MALTLTPGPRGGPQVCTGAADGYGRMARRPALTLLHLGVGLANGVANLHNAKRAGTPIVNLVGDMATWHAGADPPLAMDIQGLSDTVSSWTRTSATGSRLPFDVADALRHARDGLPGVRGRVATLIVPHDCTWQQVSADMAPAPPAAAPGALGGAAQQFLKDCAAQMKATPRGKVAMFCGARALVAADGCLHNVGKIAAATGAKLYCENNFPRIDRGVGHPQLARLPYFPNDALKELERYEMVVTLDARPPVAMFGYDGGPSQIVALPEAKVWEIDADFADAVEFLCAEVGGAGVVPGKNCGGVFVAREARPALPANLDARLTAAALCRAIAHLQPADCVVVDESLTSGGAYFADSRACPPFAHLALTGGAIGCGPPLAVGAAVACPDRTVINFQADGSGLYSAQALWTQARERLKVVTVVCKNNTYAILKVELAKQGIRGGKTNTQKLTDLGNPPVDWVALGRAYGVPSSSARTVREVVEQLRAALARDGPSLIEANL